MGQVTIVTRDGKTTLKAPYHPGMPPEARWIGGDFDRAAGLWVFDARDEERVRQLARRFFGEDGTAQETVDIQVEPVAGERERGTTELRMFGRLIASVRSRDGGAQLGNGVIVISGGFDSGGSMKYPALIVDEDTKIEIRDVPLSALEGHDPDAYEVVRAAGPDLEAAYARLQEALQALDDLGENLKPVAAMTVNSNPNLISGRSGLVARYDGEWQTKMEPRDDE